MTAADLASLTAMAAFVCMACTIAAACVVCAWAKWGPSPDGCPLLMRNGWPHNAVAHPLLVICPPLGEWIHERTDPLVPTIAGRRLVRRHPGIVLDGFRSWHRDPDPVAVAIDELLAPREFHVEPRQHRYAPGDWSAPSITVEHAPAGRRRRWFRRRR